MSGRLIRRIVPLALAAALSAPAISSSAPAGVPCKPRLLVLSAYPAEIDRLLTEAKISKTVVVDGRGFYVGRLRGNDVVLALTGIGLTNAGRTTQAAIQLFHCGAGAGITAIVFSGVAGGRSFIGDVTIPSRWTLDDGETWFEVDAAMYAKAQEAIAAGPVKLARQVPLGDPACVGIDPRLVNVIRMPRAPRIIVGGDGKSADPFGGRAFPCLPAGSNVFGCNPCRAPNPPPPDLGRFLEDALPFADPDFFLSYFESPTPSTTDWVAEDMETAATARVATENGIPFIAFRAMSDGKGDPLNLPGFPFQFFVYHQLAADNAATVALAFLEAWANG